MATDYVLRVLYERLSRAFYAYVADQSSGSATSAGYVPEYATVAAMLAADISEIRSFARCTNYTAGDGIKSLWMRASDESVDNGSDVRESTFHPGFCFERIWVKETL